MSIDEQIKWLGRFAVCMVFVAFGMLAMVVMVRLL